MNHHFGIIYSMAAILVQVLKLFWVCISGARTNNGYYLKMKFIQNYVLYQL